MAQSYRMFWLWSHLDSGSRSRNVVSGLAPAMATKPGTSDEAAVAGHKVTICHATNSASNPFVVMTIDEAGRPTPDRERVGRGGAVTTAPSPIRITLPGHGS
jgi:hypothetical protein